LNPIALFFLIAALFGFTVGILSPENNKDGAEDIDTRALPIIETSKSKAAVRPVERHEITEITTSRPPAPPSPATESPSNEQEAADREAAERRQRFEEARERQQQIKFISDDIFSKLKEEEAVTTDIIYLKTGRELHCTVIEDLETQLKVRYQGVTTTIEKADVSQMKHQSQQSADQQMRRMAIAQATKIVDNGLVQYKGEWITPKERDVRLAEEKLELEKERLKLQAAAKAQKQPAKKPVIQKVTTPPVTIGSGVDFSSVVITEGMGFGDVIVGHPRCTKRFLKSKLGEPDVEEGRRLKYDWKYGMSFTFAIDADLLIYFGLNRRFKGKLKSGISMTSTMEQVFQAYGEPRAEEEVDDLYGDPDNYANRTLYRKGHNARMFYSDLGLQFHFREDGIEWITVMRI
jgi:hypothetical protein